MKTVFLLATVFLFHGTLFSQWDGNEDPLTIKELKLTRLQVKKIIKINKEAGLQISLLKKNDPGNNESTAKIEQINGARIKKIRNNLTPEQQITWRKKLMENKPRRGITGLPNERTIH